MTVIPIREATDAEVEARMLSALRALSTGYPQLLSFLIDREELDMLLRIADERDALRREACAEPSPPDPKYVVRTCADCHHEPHGIRMLCINRFCACRNEGHTR